MNFRLHVYRIFVLEFPNLVFSVRFLFFSHCLFVVAVS